MQEKFVALIIPFYNAQNYLGACLKSVVEQSYEHLIIILVNDGSTDDSLRIAKQYALSDERIVILDRQNGGQSRARNAGIEFVMQLEREPSYIQFVDGDDVLHPHCVRDCVARMEGVDVLWFDYAIASEIFQTKVPRSQMQIFGYEQEGCIDALEWLERARTKPLFWFIWQGMIDFSYFKRINLRFVEGVIYEDHCFGILLFSRAKKIYIYPHKSYLYKIHKNSTMNPSSTIPSHSHLYPLASLLDAQDFRAYEWARSWVLSAVYMAEFFKDCKEDLMRDYFLPIFLDRAVAFLFTTTDPLDLSTSFKGLDSYFRTYALSGAECLRQGLAYRLGFAFLKNYKGLKGFFSLPLILFSTYKGYLKEQKNYHKHLLHFPHIHFDDANAERDKIKRHLSYKLGCVLAFVGGFYFVTKIYKIINFFLNSLKNKEANF